MDGNTPNVGAVNGSMTLTDDATGKSVKLPVIEGSIGPKVIDVRKLYAQTGYFTYDPGFMATAACRSSITYIDGDEGILMYRGYPIEELASKSDFMEVSYLLLYGELPTPEQKKQFVYDITHHTMVHEQLEHVLSRFPPRRPPDGGHVRRGRRAVGLLSRLHRHSRPAPADGRLLRLIAKMPTIAAMAFKYALGQPFMYPRNSLGYAENFLHMAFGVPTEEVRVSPTLASAMDKIFILHADHEQNASTATVRNAGSSGTVRILMESVGGRVTPRNQPASIARRLRVGGLFFRKIQCSSCASDTMRSRILFVSRRHARRRKRGSTEGLHS